MILLSKITAIILSLYSLFFAYAGVEYPWIHKGVFLTLALCLVFFSPDDTGKKRYFNILLAVLSILGAVYIILDYNNLMERTWYVTPITKLQYFFMGVWAITVIEGSRRSIGNFFAALVTLFLLYPIYGPYMPGPLKCHVVYRRFLDEVFLIPTGLFGVSLDIAASYIFIFILFGSFLVELGVGRFFQDLALSLTGRSRGGPAKVSVIMSALFGTISGSSVANVMTTGAFTIPLMKRIGYSPEFAGAVEAAASTGGMITPPVMAAAAFVMSEFTGVPYIQICMHSLIPALLFYLGVGMMVHFEAVKKGITGISKADMPNFKKIIISSGYMIIPFVAVIWMMIKGFSPTRAGFWGILSILLVSIIKKDTRITLPKLLTALETGAKNSVMVTLACAGAGIIIGVIGITGIGLRISSMLILISGGIKIFALMLCMIISILLGTGLTITASYIMQTSLVIPVLIQLGVDKVAAHLFTVYFCAFCGLTPPVAMTSYAAAGIARGDSMKTAVISVKLAMGAFLIPFIFVYHNSLLMMGSWTTILVRFFSSALAIIAGAAAMEGALFIKNTNLERILLYASAILLILPLEIYYDISGGVLFLFVASYNNYRKKAFENNAKKIEAIESTTLI